MSSQRPAAGHHVHGDVAIVGVACTYPNARNPIQFWQNIVNKVSAIADVDPARWDPEVFYDPDPDKEDKIYSKKGGYLPNYVLFNPLKVGVPPSAIEGAEPDHYIVLRAVYEALDDAGYLKKHFDRDRVSVLLGKGNYNGPGLTWLMQRTVVTEVVMQIVKGLRPDLNEDQLEKMKEVFRRKLPKLNTENAAGLIPNISTGRVANRLDFMGQNLTIDAACASSLIATENALHNLLSGKDDMVIAGGMHLFAHIPFLSVFDKTRAMSTSGVIRPFDANADGTMSGEGVGIMVLKRLADAERDGDRIYAVVKGAGSASDGKAKGVMAPRIEGEELAVRRALEMAQVDPATVELIEGHGTGTLVGDQTEIDALKKAFGPSETGRATIALGSVKSNIGHAMPAAGAAGLIKTALALYHKILPPTLNVTDPHPSLKEANTRFYVNTEARPWVHNMTLGPRRAGVNAFGFGGINAHVVLEEYPRQDETKGTTLLREWDQELFIFEGATREELAAKLDSVRAYIMRVEGVAMRDLAYTLNTALTGLPERLAIVATSFEDLAKKIDRVKGRITDPKVTQIRERQGLYYFTDPELKNGKVAFMYPGEGAQYVNMLADLAMHFPVVRRAFDIADSAERSDGQAPVSAVVFPPPPFSEQEEAAQEAQLFSIQRATETVLTADGAAFQLMESLGLKAHMMTGHSAGEWIAMASSGMVDVELFIRSMDRLGQMYEAVANSTDIPRKAMLALGAGKEKVEEMARQIDVKISIANDNCPHQVVVVVEPEDAEKTLNYFLKGGVFVEQLPYDRGYHTHAFKYISEPLRKFFESLNLKKPDVPVYSCTTASLMPSEQNEILDVVADTFARPLIFQQTIEQMYNDGARIFVELGPRGNLTAFADDILRGKAHLAVPIDQFRRPGLLGLTHALGLLTAAHVPLNLATLYERRAARKLTFDVKADTVIPEEKMPGMVKVPTTYAVVEPIPAEMIPPIPASLKTVETVATPVPTPAAAPAPAPAPKVEAPAAPQPVAAAYDDGDLPGYQPVVAAAPAMVAVAPQQAEVTYIYPNGVSEPPQTMVQEHFHLMEDFLRTQHAVMAGMMGGVAVESPDFHPSVIEYDPYLDDYGYGYETAYTDVPQAAPTVPGEIPPGMFVPPPMELPKPEPVVNVPVAPVVAAPPAPKPVQLPVQSMLHTSRVLDFQPGKSMKMEVTLDANEHKYLHDHCLYFNASEHNNQGNNILAMPMTGSVELMCEAAMRAIPGKRPIAVRNASALRPVNVEANAAPSVFLLDMKINGDNVYIGIKSTPKNELLCEATVVMAYEFPETPTSTEPLELVNPKQAKFRKEEIYSSHSMFHGPRFHGIQDIDEVGENGLKAKLKILPNKDCFASTTKPHYMLDPHLFDAAGQLVGYWPLEYLNEGFVLLPIRLGEVAMFCESPAPGTDLECKLWLRSITARYVIADFDVILPDGRVWLRVKGWQDWRFYWEPRFYNFWRFCSQYPIGLELTSPALEKHNIVCRILDPMPEMEKPGLSEMVFTRMILERGELAEYLSLTDDNTRLKWLFSRAIAKDAVCNLMKQQRGKTIFPADAVLRAKTGGIYELQSEPAVRVASCFAYMNAVGVAGQSPMTVVMRAVVAGEAPAETAFVPEEREWIQRLSRPDEWTARAIGAKQAAAQWLRPDSTDEEFWTTLLIPQIDEANGVLTVTDPGSAADPLTVITLRSGDTVVAIATK